MVTERPDRRDEEILYRELAAEVRSTDDVSFRLLACLLGWFALGLVLAGLAGLNVLAMTCISLVGATISLALYRWELRNLQICASAIRAACEVEGRLFPDLADPERRGVLFPRLPAPSLLGYPMGKAQAEKVLYIAVILGWLSLPVIAWLGGHADVAPEWLGLDRSAGPWLCDGSVA